MRNGKHNASPRVVPLKPVAHLVFIEKADELRRESFRHATAVIAEAFEAAGSAATIEELSP